MGQNPSVKHRYEALSPFRDERQRRLMVGTEAAALGYGGISAVSRATGVCGDTIRRGLAELNAEADEDFARLRKPGGGRKQAKDEQPGLLDALRELVEPITRGDPESPLRWVSKGVRKLSAALREQGFVAGRTLVGRLLRARPGITAACDAFMGCPAAQRRHGGRRPAIHAFAALSTAKPWMVRLRGP
jgi:DDE family transposase